MIQGIHHITAIASNPKKTVEFYSKILGLRLVKKTVNQDDVSAYHLFFGDRLGSPGMDLTFFTFPGVAQGSRGVGQVTSINLAVPQKSLTFWQKRFESSGVKQEEIIELFGKQRLTFYDSDNQRLQLVGVEADLLKSFDQPLWTTAEVGKTQAIRSFYSARLSVVNLDSANTVLTKGLAYLKQEAKEELLEYHLNSSSSPVARAGKLEVEVAAKDKDPFNAAGTVHHIAFGVADEKDLLKARANILSLGLQPTEIIDRYYFKSVYFRTRAGILFELATHGPGFTVDENEAELGLKLALPPFLEAYRTEIEGGLEKI